MRGKCTRWAGVAGTLLAAAAAAQDVGLGSPAVAAPGGMAAASAPPSHVLELSGYVIAGGSWVQEDPQFLQVGHNNGFTLADARLEITGKPLEQVWVYLSIDGAVRPADSTDLQTARRAVELKDAYGVWAPGFHLRVQAGQFKAPQDLEELLEETDLHFPTRSIVSAGVTPPYGYAAEGFALGRQLGVAVGTDAVPLPFGSLTAQAALTNGNGENHVVNDTQIPSVTGRVSISFHDVASLGFDGYYQPRAYGTQPNLFRDDRVGAGADLRIESHGAHVLLLAAWRKTTHLTTGGPDETATGFSAEAAYRWRFLEPALRYSALSPSSVVPASPVSEFTAALNFYAGNAARLSASFAHRGEETGRELSNDSFDLSAQVRF